MPDQKRYLTCGVDSIIPLELQLFLWECVDRMPAPRDYLQVFELKPVGILQAITHRSEEPAYKMEYVIPMVWCCRHHRSDIGLCLAFFDPPLH